MRNRSNCWFVRLLILAWGLVLTTGLWAICPTTVLPPGGAGSQVARCPMISTSYTRGIYVIRASEITASGLAGGSVLTGIGWHYNTAPGQTGTAPLVVYLQNT